MDYRVICKDLDDLQAGPMIWNVDSFDRAEKQIKLVYDTGRYNHWTFLIQSRNRNGSWDTVEGWTIGDYLDGETNWGK